MAALLFRRRLEHEGYAVDIAVDGEMGLAMCVEVDYDLIALDYNMPKLDGISVLRELNQREEMPPVVIITAQNDTATAVEAMRLGAYDYLVKGTNAAYLLLLPGVINAPWRNAALSWSSSARSKRCTYRIATLLCSTAWPKASRLHST